MSRITVEVVLALPNAYWRREVELAATASAGEAVRASGLEAVYRQHGGRGTPAIGVFGRKVGRDAPLRAGDRVEIYRELSLEPRQARRARVAAKRARE